MTGSMVRRVAALIASIGIGCAVQAQTPTELLVGSWQTHSVRRYDLLSGAYLGDLVTSGAGGLNVPDGLAWGTDGNLYVSSSNSNQVLRFDGASGSPMGAFVASGLNKPGNLQFGPDGRLYVCNKGTNQVLRFDESTGTPLGVFAQGGGLVNPVGLAWADGLLYVAGFNSNAIHRFNAITGAVVGTPISVVTPLILRIGEGTGANEILVSTHQLDGVRRYDRTSGAFLGSIGPGGPIDCPVGHLNAPDGTILIASWQNHRLLRYSASGVYMNTFAIGGGLLLPNDLLLRPPAPCSADCDSSGGLTIDDFICFQTLFALSDPAADCDMSGDLTIDDFICFQTLFAIGC